MQFIVKTAHLSRLAPRKSTPALLLACGLLGACANAPFNEQQKLINNLPERADKAQSRDLQRETQTSKERFFKTPGGLPTIPEKPMQVTPPVKLPDEPGKEATVVFNSMPLPQFIDSVFGVVLKRTIAIDPAIQQRRDLVSMRADKPQTPAQLYESAKAVVRAYGITVQELPGLTRFIPDALDTNAHPEVRRGRALPEVPESLRPQFFIVELANTTPANAAGFIRTTFGGKVTATEDPTRNAVVLSGTSSVLNAAMQALITLDQPLLRGKISARIAPTYWSADQLAQRLNEVMMAQGISAGTAAGSQTPVILLPIGPINSILVFSTSQSTLEHILKWAEELDRPTESRNGNYFIYPVRNADASAIADTLAQIIGGGSTASATTTGAAGGTGVTKSSRIVVDKAGNNIIIQASPAEYQQWLSLLREIDKPAKSALISVTVAEIQLTDNVKLGFEWIISQLQASNYIGDLRTLGNLGTSGIGGLSLVLNRGTSPAMVLNALAETTNAKVLSNPSVMARSGENATISIGDEVPTLTSSQSAGTSSTTGTTTTPNIVQTVQYRNTGIILNVKPVVRNGGRIDLDITQEVSSVIDAGGATLTPSISTRRLDTKLTALDGNTIVLGGLIRENDNYTDKGVPFAKDIPILGNLFKSRGDRTVRTELVMMITAYAMEDDYDAQSIVDAVKRRFPWSAPLMNTRTIKNGVTSLAAEPVTSAVPKEELAYEFKSSTSPESELQQAGTTPTTAGGSLPVHSPATQTPSPAPASTTTLAAPEKRTTDAKGVVIDEDLKRELMEAMKAAGIKPR